MRNVNASITLTLEPIQYILAFSFVFTVAVNYAAMLLNISEGCTELYKSLFGSHGNTPIFVSIDQTIAPHSCFFLLNCGVTFLLRFGGH